MDVTPTAYNIPMAYSYTVLLWCGCRVYVSCHPRSRLTNTRIVEKRGIGCGTRNHQVGTRLWLWELLPDRRQPEVEIQFEAS
ncbi:MAG TPA: hypothetical protein VNJ03_00365 [Vicinamibacterales bacterium]|nr:hypothetical protein [Vicinamibacterales bacterium]